MATLAPQTTHTEQQILDIMSRVTGGAAGVPYRLAGARLAGEAAPATQARVLGLPTDPVTVGSPVGHLQTAQSQRGSNFRSGSRIGGGGSVSSGGGIGRSSAGRVSGAGSSGLSTSLQGSSAALALQRIMDQMSGGSRASLPSGGSSNPLYAGTPVSTTSATATGEAAAPAAAPSIDDLLQALRVQAAMEEIQQSQIVSQTNPTALALFERLVGAGPSSAATAATERSGQAQQAALSMVANLQAMMAQGANSGALAGIRRQATEEGLSGIARASEAGGSSQNALASLLESDLFSRMQEAQGRLDTDTRLGAASAASSLLGQYPGLYQNPAQQELSTLLGYGAQLPVLAERPGATSPEQRTRSISSLLGLV